MRLVARAVLAGGLGFAAALLVAACGGGSGLLSSDQANTLNGQLNQLASAVGSHNCNAAQNASQSFATAVAGLPQTVNSTVRSNLTQGASTISDLAVRDCQNKAPTTPTATTATATTQTTTQPTTTTHQATTTTTNSNPPPPTTHQNPPPTTPSGGGSANGGGGDGGGNASGGGGLSGGGNGQ